MNIQDTPAPFTSMDQIHAHQRKGFLHAGAPTLQQRREKLAQLRAVVLAYGRDVEKAIQLICDDVRIRCIQDLALTEPTRNLEPRLASRYLPLASDRRWPMAPIDYLTC